MKSYQSIVSVFATAVLACTLLFYGRALGGEVVKMSDGVYYYSGEADASSQNSFGANAGIVVGDNGILIIDALVSAKAAGRFIDDIRKVSDKPVRYVVDTHGHLDHAFGNSEFEKLGAVIIAHEDVLDYLRKFGEETLGNAAAYGLTEDDMAGTHIAYPSITFADRMSIDLGGRTVELIYTGPSHSPGSIVVNIPAEGVAFAGDILFTDFHPFLGEGDLEGWQRALDELKALKPARIIPGHGPVSGDSDIDAMKEYLRDFDNKARELSKKSDDPAYISAELLKSLPERTKGDFLVNGNVQMRYLAK